MPYARKSNSSRKYGAKKSLKYYKKAFKSRRGISKTKSLVSLIKKVSLQKVETKHTHFIVNDQQLYHNNGYIKLKLLDTSQGITDTQTGTTFYAGRIGDQIVARGISIKLWVANKLDRPNVMYRIIVFKYQSATTPTSTSIFTGANGNKMMDDIDREYVTPVYQKIFNLQMGFSASVQAAIAGDTEGREAHKYLSFYIPLKNKVIQYTDGSTIPKFIDYGFRIVPYDSYGTLETDIIASMSFQYKLYFKDP